MFKSYQFLKIKQAISELFWGVFVALRPSNRVTDSVFFLNFTFGRLYLRQQVCISLVVNTETTANKCLPVGKMAQQQRLLDLIY